MDNIQSKAYAQTIPELPASDSELVLKTDNNTFSYIYNMLFMI